MAVFLPYTRRARLALAFAAALICAGAAARTADAAFPGSNGIIVYEARSSALGAFYARTASGSGLRRLLPGGAVRDPAFSPEGLRLAYAREGAIWIMYADGTGVRKLTNPQLPDAQPAWSPHDDALAFTRGRRGDRHIFTIGADGTGRRQLTYAGRDDTAPAWSSTDRIAFVRTTRHSGNDIYVTTPTGAAAQRLTRSRLNDEAPSWSPDGARIAFVRGRGLRRDIWVMDAAGRHARRLTRLKAPLSSPAWSPDGRRIAFANGKVGRRQVHVVGANGRGMRQLTRGRSDAHAPDWQPTGADPLIAAAGDIACDPVDGSFRGGLGTSRRCHQLQTSNLLLRSDLSAVLVLGDAQYERGTLDAFQASFAPTWGRFQSLLRPVPGNHEYLTPGAAGYFDYFNGPGQPTGPAGSRDSGWYSYDIGTWHVVALNSQCSEPVRRPTAAACAPGSPQEQWLRADLAAHPAACTLAYWHHPLFTSSVEGTSPTMRPIWQALYDGGVDVILNGHAHTYERFAPQTPDGAPDPVRGIREFVVGSGGKSHQGFFAFLPNSEVHDSSTFGILQMVLGRGSYRWAFVPDNPRGFVDAGTGACH